MLVKDETVEGLPRSPPPPPPPSSSSSSSSKCNYGNANTQSCAAPPWCWTDQKCGANPAQAAPPPPPSSSCASRSKCGVKLIVSVVGTLIFLKLCKLAACVLGFFLGWVVIPAGGAVLGLGFAVATRLISTVFYTMLLGFAVWRFTWLVSLCYVAGNGLRTHWSKRHDYFNGAKLWFWMKKEQWRASAVAQATKPHREKLRKLEQRLHQVKQEQQRRAHGSANTDTVAAEKPSHKGAANIPGAVPQQQPPQQQQQQQQQRPPRPSAPAQAMPAPGASTDFLEFAAAMSDALAQYERANGLPVGTTNTFISEQRQQQQQQHAEGRLYPRLDSDDGTVTV